MVPQPATDLFRLSGRTQSEVEPRATRILEKRDGFPDVLGGNGGCTAEKMHRVQVRGGIAGIVFWIERDVGVANPLDDLGEVEAIGVSFGVDVVKMLCEVVR